MEGAAHRRIVRDSAAPGKFGPGQSLLHGVAPGLWGPCGEPFRARPSRPGERGIGQEHPGNLDPIALDKPGVGGGPNAEPGKPQGCRVETVLCDESGTANRVSDCRPGHQFDGDNILQTGRCPDDRDVQGRLG